MRTLQPCHLVTTGATLREAMGQINQSGLGIVFVVEQQRLFGTLTDGDIRRALLAGASLTHTIGEFVNRHPTTVAREASSEQVQSLFLETQLKVIPAVEPDGHLLGLHVFNDLVTLAGGVRPVRASLATLPLTAVLMAGGLGTRMKPLTDERPKPLIEIGGMPMLEHSIRHLERCGVREVVITTRYLGHMIEEYFEDGARWGVNISYQREEQRLGTAGALSLLSDRIGERPFLVMNGDLLTNANIENMLDFHHQSKAALTVAGRHYTINVPFGVIETDGYQVTKLVEKPDYDFFVNAGIYILEPSMISRIPVGEFYDITELIRALLEDGGEVACYPMDEDWIDVGRPEDLPHAERMLRRLF